MLRYAEVAGLTASPRSRSSAVCSRPGRAKVGPRQRLYRWKNAPTYLHLPLYTFLFLPNSPPKLSLLPSPLYLFLSLLSLTYASASELRCIKLSLFGFHRCWCTGLSIPYSSPSPLASSPLHSFPRALYIPLSTLFSPGGCKFWPGELQGYCTNALTEICKASR